MGQCVKIIPDISPWNCYDIHVQSGFFFDDPFFPVGVILKISTCDFLQIVEEAG